MRFAEFDRYRLNVLLVCCVVLISCAEESVTDFGAWELETFQTAELKGLNTGNAQILDYQGRVVVLNLWATWCGPCRREMPSLVSLQKKLGMEKFAVVGLSVDEDDHVASEWLLDKKIELISYIDSGGKNVAEPLLNVNAYPYTLIINRQGEIIARVQGAKEWDDEIIVNDLMRAYEMGRMD